MPVIKDTSKIDLATIDVSLKLGQVLLSKVSDLPADEYAKANWRHEIEASNKRLEEMRPGYEDGRTEARHMRDRVVMLMHCDLTYSFIDLLESKKEQPCPQPSK